MPFLRTIFLQIKPESLFFLPKKDQDVSLKSLARLKKSCRCFHLKVKTFFANQFPDPLMLNTDGNIKFVDAPYIAIRDTVTVEGRLTKRHLAWEVFADAVAELEKKQNDSKTIVVDLLEDTYEACRVYICDRQGWKPAQGRLHPNATGPRQSIQIGRSV